MTCYLFSVSNALCFSSMSVLQAAQQHIGLSNIGHRSLPKIGCTEYTAQGNNFELILMVKMEIRHPVKGSFSSEFPAICNHCKVMTA